MFENFRSRNHGGKNVVTLAATADALQAEVPAAAGVDRALQAHLELKSRMHEALLDRLNLAMIDKVEGSELRRQVGTLVAQLLEAEGTALRRSRAR